MPLPTIDLSNVSLLFGSALSAFAVIWSTMKAIQLLKV